MHLGRGVSLLRDLGVTADVYRYQQLPQKQLALQKRRVMAGELQQLFTQQMHKLQEDKDALEQEEEQVHS
jgi:hypothetical protein